MYEQLKQLVIWSEREAIAKNMPLVFRSKFHRCMVILDCYEIFIERSTALKSEYKHGQIMSIIIP